MHIKLTRALIGKLLCLALLFIGWSYGAAKAESLVYTDTVPIQAMNWNRTLTLPQFNPTLGILTHVEITVTGGISGSIGYENFPAQTPVSVTGQVNAQLQLNLPQNQFLLASRELISITESASGYDGAIDFGGTSGATHYYTGTLSAGTAYTTPAALQPYIGFGNLTLPLAAVSDWDAGGGSANIIVALRTDGGGGGVIRYDYAIPSIVIKKFTNGFDADNPDDPDVPQLQPGATVTWTYRITNTGTITIPGASVVVTDSQPGVIPVLVSSSDSNGDNLLSPGESWRYMATGTVQTLATPSAGTTVVTGCNPNDTQVPGGQPTYFNLGRVTVPGATGSDPSHYCNPPVARINLAKTVYRGHDSGAGCPGSESITHQVGAPITYCFVITNTGETYLDTLVFTDTLLGINLSNLIRRSGTTPLAPTASLVYYYETTMPGDARLNTARVEGNPTDDQGRDLPGLDNPRDEDTAQVTPLPTGADPETEPRLQLFMPLVRR